MPPSNVRFTIVMTIQKHQLFMPANQQQRTADRLAKVSKHSAEGVEVESSIASIALIRFVKSTV